MVHLVLRYNTITKSRNCFRPMIAKTTPAKAATATADEESNRFCDAFDKHATSLTDGGIIVPCHMSLCKCDYKNNKKGQLSLTNPHDACETFARFM